MIRIRKGIIGLVLIVGVSSWVFSSLNLEIVPTTFDFGWFPSNAKVSAQFQLKNTSESILPVIDVLPSCGCTAPSFTPADLSSMEEMTVGLTFNTRGYDGRSFNKKSSVKTELEDNRYEVWLKGHVKNPDAKVLPLGSGIVAFEQKTTKRTQLVSIANKTEKPVMLGIIQEPAYWAKYELPEKTIEPGKTVDLKVTVKPPYDKVKQTSLTLEAIENVNTHRLTIAIRTGPPPQPYRRFKSPK
ncbi:hypothetical protein BVX98_02235 [bacterium F11]|nr:hypothetical protein BVX98_02235 [bacterium F11]